MQIDGTSDYYTRILGPTDETIVDAVGRRWKTGKKFFNKGIFYRQAACPKSSAN